MRRDRLIIPGYSVVSVVHDGQRRAVYRARSDKDGSAVIVKTLLDGVSPPEASAALRQEADTTGQLMVEGVPRVLGLELRGNRPALILEDLGGHTLSTLIRSNTLSLQARIEVARNLANILGAIHAARIVHRDINPANILVESSTLRTAIIDFGLAATFDSIRSTLPTERALEGTPAYVSPEQTGRTGWEVDHRSDLYSLGITLYELFTGQRPFKSQDALKVIHAHTALQPAPPESIDPQLPAGLSGVILKLLAKSPNERYQTAAGLAADLLRCSNELTAKGQTSAFEPGASDFGDRLTVPHRLYGRGKESAALAESLTRAKRGQGEAVLVAGYSGIGKTGLVRELSKPVIVEGGYFISGKFDQLVRGTPYTAICEAFSELARQLLMESDQDIQRWREKILEALGASAQVVLDLLPDFEPILGTQPAVPALGPAEAQNRFNRNFRSFFRVFANPDRPLVLFLDDLQWVDSASMDLLQVLLDGSLPGGLLVVGAYRDNEVGDDHILARAIAQFEASGTPMTQITLPPLGEAALREFVVDTLRGDEAHATPLAELVAKKTGGNPFFMTQFMKSLAQEQLLLPDHTAGVWTYDLNGIAGQPSTDNVVDLLAGRINRFADSSRAVLKVAACLGNRFDEETLAIAFGESTKHTRAALREGLLEGLVVMDEGDVPTRSYRFLHDRVQQAAYALIPEDESPSMHIAIGRSLLESMDDDARSERVFELIDQIRRGLPLIQDEEERRIVFGLAVTAGRRARAAAAYAEALDYFHTAEQLLSPDAWSAAYEETFDLMLGIAECEYLSGHFDEALKSFDHLESRAASPLDSAKVQILRAAQYETRSNYVDAVTAIRAGLAPLGIEFPDREGFDTALDRELDEVEGMLGRREIASLIDLPPLEDAATKMCMRLLAAAWSCTYILGDTDLIAWIPTKMVRLSLAHGNTEESAYGYVAHGITLGTRRSDYRRGHEFGLLALALNDALDDLPFRGKVHELFGCFVNLWRRPLVECIESQRTAFLAGIEGGDFAYGTYGGFVETWYRFLTSEVLDGIEEESAPTVEFLESIHNDSFVAAERLILNWAQALRGMTSSSDELDNDQFSETHFLEYHREPAFFQVFYHIIKLHLYLTTCQYDKACSSAASGEKLIFSLSATIWPMLARFYGAIARAAVCGARQENKEQGSEPDRAECLKRLQADVAVLAEWAKNCPENFSHAELLVRAEIARISGDGTATEDLYVAAIEAANVRGFPGDLGLANERYARYWLERNHDRVGSMFLLEALRIYDAWGAKPKAEQLATELSRLVGGNQENGHDRTTLTSAAAVLATLQSPSQALDFEWAMKAAGAISSEIELNSLLRTLMRTLLESAGAERGCLILEQGEKAVVRVRVDAASGETSVEASAVAESDCLPETVWRYVLRTRKHLVLDDATADATYSNDPYIQVHKPRSVICLPVIYQGDLLGAVYLENNLHTAAFTRNHLYLLETLSAHAAIAIRNAESFEEIARLEERLRAENVILQETIRTQHDFEEIVGESPALMEVLQQLEQVAPTDTTVLILGETGTGKELLARAIHRLSPRCDQSLVTVNCGAISPGLIESELFGHEKGAFTGAVSRKIGRFELADGGTLLLDEIGDLALDLQVKLLRVLQEGEIERVGGGETIKVDVRVIAGTHRDLAAAAEEGRFRADLYYRLNVFPIRNPPLRERREDIPLLVRHFLMKDGMRLGKRLETIPKRTMDTFIAYPWPGNIRELRNVIERSIITSRGTALELGNWLTTEQPAGNDHPHQTLDEVQRSHIVRTLEECGWVVSGMKGAAKRLGLKPTTLEARMRKLGIERPN